MIFDFLLSSNFSWREFMNWIGLEPIHQMNEMQWKFNLNR